jgi:hypothetical protein
LITFGSGSDLYSSKTPSDFNFRTDHQQKLPLPENDGQFSFVNTIPKGVDSWQDGVSDHTENDTGGYMFLVDMGAHGTEIFSTNVHNLSIGLRYEFSAYLANIIRKDKLVSYPEPNILFEVRTSTAENQLLAQLSTGDISKYDEMTWSKYGLSFVTPSSSVVLSLISNVQNLTSIGNDVAIDDIELRVCSTNYSGNCSTGWYDRYFSAEHKFSQHLNGLVNNLFLSSFYCC